MTDTGLTLISHPLCPFVQRAAIVLLEKGVPFQRVNIDLSVKPDWFLALSPTGKVPVLKVRQAGAEDAVLFESVVICEYLNETQGGASMYPDDALARARHRAWIEFANQGSGEGLRSCRTPALINPAFVALSGHADRRWSTRHGRPIHP